MAGLVPQVSYSKGEVSPELGGRVDLATYRSSLATARNVIVRPYGSIVNRPGTKFIGYNINPTTRSRLRRFRFNTTDTYILEFNDFTMRVIKNDAYVLEASKPVAGILSAAPTVLNVVAHGYNAGDALQFIGAVPGMPRFTSRWVVVASIIDANNVTLQTPGSVPIDSTTYGSYLGGAFVSRVYTVVTPYPSSELPALSFVQSADVMTINHHSYDEKMLTRTGDAAWTITTPTFAPAQPAPTGVNVVPDAAAAASFTYTVTAISASTGEESVMATPFTLATSNATRANTITWVAAPNTSLYTVYLNQNGVYGLIGTTPDLTFHDANYAPSFSVTPPTARNPFAGASNRPATSAYYQQRQVRGGSNSGPDTLFASQVGNFYNYSVAQPSSDSDAITVTLTSREVNAIRHFVPVKQDLLCFTAGAEWRITANGQAFTAANLQILPQSSWGSSFLEPILQGLTVLFVRENGLTVRSARYAFQADAYTGEDVSLLSNHLFSPTSQITSWAAGLTPDPLTIGVLTSGAAACLTYQEEQQMTAWTHWDTQGGAFEDVECVRPNLIDNLDDVPYFVVNRLIQGVHVRYVERLASRRWTDVRDAFFVDAGLTYDNPVSITNIINSFPVTVVCPGHSLNTGSTVDIFGVNWTTTLDDTGNPIAVDQLNGNRYVVTVINSSTITLDGVDGSGWASYSNGGTLRAVATVVTGLDHLEGETVAALCDGNAYLGLTVTDGALTLPIPSSRVHVGKQIVADIETLDLEPQQGSIQGKIKRTAYVNTKVKDSRGWLIGETTADLIETKLRQYEELGDPIALLSGVEQTTIGSNPDLNGRVFIRQMYPLPLEVLSIMPEMEVED